MAAQIDVPNVVIPSMLKALPVQQRSIFARLVKNMDTLQVYASQSRNLAPNIVPYQITAEEMENNSDYEVEEDEDSYSDDSFILYQMKAEINQAKSKVPKKTHLIANILIGSNNTRLIISIWEFIWTHVQM